jgi:hypothetical protein
MRYFVHVEYARAESLVIEAKLEEEARQIAYKNNGDEIKIIDVDKI